MIRHEVLTTEKVPFSYRVAGLGSRFAAWLIDLLALMVLECMGVLVGSVLAVGRPGLGNAIVIVWQFVVMWGYFLLFEWLWHGQTPGKYLLGIRVIQWRGTPGLDDWVAFIAAGGRSKRLILADSSSERRVKALLSRIERLSRHEIEQLAKG